MNGPRFNSQLLKVPLYIAGKSPEEVKESLGLDEVIKLASNENPLGPSPKAVAALQEFLPAANRYPGIAERELRRKLAAYYGNGFSEHHFLIGNGGTDVLRLIAQSFVFEGGETIMSSVTFPMYRIFTTMFGGQSVEVDLMPDFQQNLEGMAEAITEETRIVWLCSPNNPTGLVLSQREVDAFLEKVPNHVVIVFDESYRDFVTDPDALDSTSYIRQGLSAILVRSFSKSAGLANLRVGYAIAQPDLIEYLLHTLLPFNTGALVINAAIASLDDHEYLKQSRELVINERKFLYERISDMGLSCLPTQANFLLIMNLPGGGKEFAERITQRGIIVRPMGGFGRQDAIRVTVGLRDQNERFLNALTEALAET